MVETMAEGLIELRESEGVDIASERGIQYFLDRFYINRISIRMLQNQHRKLLTLSIISGIKYGIYFERVIDGIFSDVDSSIIYRMKILINIRVI